MRWDNLRIDGEQEARLPRFMEPAVVRTFDAPEAMGIRFYEVRARSGIPCSVLVAPLIPGVNDDPGQVEEILEIAGEMGAANVTGIGLHLRGEVREIFFDWLRQYRPDLIEHYEQLYARGAYLPIGERKRLGALTNGFRRRAGAPRPMGWRGRGISRERKEPSSHERKPEAQQARLF